MTTLGKIAVASRQMSEAGRIKGGCVDVSLGSVYLIWTVNSWQ